MPCVEKVETPEVGQLLYFYTGSPHIDGPYEVVEPFKTVRNIHTKKEIPWPKGQPSLVTPEI